MTSEIEAFSFFSHYTLNIATYIFLLSAPVIHKQGKSNDKNKVTGKL